MKNILIKISLLCICILILTGCGKHTTKCTKVDEHKDYTVEEKYNIYSKNDIVYKVEEIKIIKTRNNTIREYIEKQLDNNFLYNSNEYGGYTKSVNKTKETLTYKVTIDYKKIDLKKFTNANSLERDKSKKKGIETSKIKKMYEMISAKCE